MVKLLAQAFGGDTKKGDAIKVNDMSPDKAVSALNNFFGAIK